MFSSHNSILGLLFHANLRRKPKIAFYFVNFCPNFTGNLANSLLKIWSNSGLKKVNFLTSGFCAHRKSSQKKTPSVSQTVMKIDDGGQSYNWKTKIDVINEQSLVCLDDDVSIILPNIMLIKEDNLNPLCAHSQFAYITYTNKMCQKRMLPMAASKPPIAKCTK